MIDDTLFERLSDIQSTLARIDERTAHIATRITQHDTDIDALKMRQWLVVGAVGIVAWFLNGWREITDLFRQ